MNRRLLTVAFFAVFLAQECFPAEPAMILLPSPKKTGGISVETALSERRSVRAYTKESLTMAELGQLLWAAQGVTGPDGKRTAPSAMHRYPLEIGVVDRVVEPAETRRAIAEALAAAPPGRGAHGNIPL